MHIDVLHGSLALYIHRLTINLYMRVKTIGSYITTDSKEHTKMYATQCNACIVTKLK